MASALLLLLVLVSGAAAAPTEPPANPFLEGLDSFLAAFDGFELPGDPVLEAAAAAVPPEVTEPPPELQEATIEPEVAFCLGCVQEIVADTASLRRVAQSAAYLLEEQLNLTQVTTVTQVYQAAEQVVNGIMYFLTLELAPTNCSRPLEEGDECSLDPEAERLLYKVEVLEHPQIADPINFELLLFTEVSPEEVAALPGLYAGPEPPPPPPSEQPAVSASSPAGIDADLAALIGDMEVFTLLSAPESAPEQMETADPPATAEQQVAAAGA